MNKKIECPSCGSEIQKTKTEERTIKIDTFQSFQVTSDEFVCEVCGYDGEEDEEAEDNKIELAKKESDQKTLAELINASTKDNLSATYIERAFKLPPRTLNRWRSQKGSATSLAFMKIIKSMSWIVDVADHGYEKKYIDSIIQEEAKKIVRRKMEENNIETSIIARTTTNALHVSATFTKLGNTGCYYSDSIAEASAGTALPNNVYNIKRTGT